MPNLLFFGGLTLLVAGLMSVGASALNLEVFFQHPSAQQIVRSLGRTGARLFYVVLGAFFVLIGIFLTLRAWQLMNASA